MEGIEKMSVTIECIIKKYLTDKSNHDKRVLDMIHKINTEIQNYSADSFELSDAVLLSSSEVPSGKTNNKTDAAYSVLARYNYLSKKIEQENSEHINEMLDYLNYLGNLKKLYGQISFIAITLETRQSKALGILMNGGKICEASSELDVSYVTARRTIEAAIETIADAIDDNLKELILKDYEKYNQYNQFS